MSKPLGKPSAATRATGSEGPTEGQGDDLLNRARELEAEQTAALETAAVETVEARYGAALAVQVEAKHEQAERLEDRLEALIGQQQARLQQTQANPPGLLAWPGARAKWDQQRQGQQVALQRLQGRLETVREIREGMGLHSPRIKELARRKLQAQDPALIDEWKEFREAQRQHQALMRKQKQEERERNRGMETAPRLTIRLER